MPQKLYLLFCFVSFGLFAQAPDYYSGIDFTQDNESIRQQLTTLLTDTHTYMLEYTPEVWEVLKESDLESENSDDVLLLYGYDNEDSSTQNDRTRDKDLNCTSSSCIGLWNREHVFPKSLATPPLSTSYPSAGTDAHALRACDSQMNSSRGNRAYAEGDGNATTAANETFYPGDEWKGDVARIIMYMYVRYPSQCAANDVGAGPSTYADLSDMPDFFLEWNAEDPVSDYEIHRNNTIAATQGNRNPFIDNPYLATMIWNGPEAEETWQVLSIEDVTRIETYIYPTVSSSYVYVESTTATQEYTYQIYSVSGQKVGRGTTENRISIADLQSGVYFIKLMDGNASQTHRFIVP